MPTPTPNLTTSPTASFPPTAGNRFGNTGYVPSTTFISLGFTVATFQRTKTSSGPKVGTGKFVSTRSTFPGRPCLSNTTAFVVVGNRSTAALA